ncbi:MAG TPA: hypothetical protein VG963_14875 [Polyangiaceae bacterium]|nr:hypothetical protein [Polyangiaceae bacterium]
MLYVRIDDHKYQLLMRYVREHELTATALIESLVDQLLLQIAPDEFQAPEWLVQAILNGDLPHRLPAAHGRDCGELPGDPPVANIVGLRHTP